MIELSIAVVLLLGSQGESALLVFFLRNVVGHDVSGCESIAHQTVRGHRMLVQLDPFQL